MPAYKDLSIEELTSLKAALEEEHATHKASGLSLNMARGKPSSDQLDLSLPMLDAVNSKTDFINAQGIDLRNYAILDGLPEAKALMGAMLDEDPENVVIFGNSSLSIEYGMMHNLFSFGTQGHAPWRKLDKVKWLCPCPGYDRHFGITETFGVELITVPIHVDGPDMDIVEELVAKDASIKGMWCIPKYSNPTGITYSDEVVRRLASMPTAAEDFRIFWDNAYCVHHLYDEPENQDVLLDLGRECVKAGHPDRYLKFGSTSKVTFPGAGIAAFAASPANVAECKERLSVQTIGYDKLNQLRHVLFLKDAEGLAAHMSKHAALLRPKFDLVLKMLDEGLKPDGYGHWEVPRGGYFISFDAPEGTAKRIVTLAKEAGVTMTDAGATFPGHKDPKDSNIRIAPTLPPLEELEKAIEVFVCCVKLATVEVELAAKTQA